MTYSNSSIVEINGDLKPESAIGISTGSITLGTKGLMPDGTAARPDDISEGYNWTKGWGLDGTNVADTYLPGTQLASSFFKDSNLDSGDDADNDLEYDPSHADDTITLFGETAVIGTVGGNYDAVSPDAVVKAINNGEDNNIDVDKTATDVAKTDAQKAVGDDVVNRWQVDLKVPSTGDGDTKKKNVDLVFVVDKSDVDYGKEAKKCSIS